MCGAVEQRRGRVCVARRRGRLPAHLCPVHVIHQYVGDHNDVLVNTFTNNFQINPAVACLANGNVAVVWGSYNQESDPNALQGVYGQLLSPTGQKVGAEFQVNTYTPYNQRTPAVAALPGGGFVVAWVSEMERFDNSVDVYARLFNASAAPVSGELPVNTGTNVCANPSVAAASDGTFMVAWGERDLTIFTNGWDVYARGYSSSGAGGSVACVNQYRFGDQYAPRLAAAGTDFLAVWTSLAQDGSREGVFGRFLHEDATPLGAEFMVNTTTANQQIHPAVGTDGQGRFLAVWTSFTGLTTGFDLFAQRYVNVAQPLAAMNAPFVGVPFVLSNGVYQPRLQVSWPVQAGLAIDHYEVYVDGASAATGSVVTNLWTMTAANGLTANSTHTFQVGYVTTSMRRSPLSPSASGTTWSGLNWGSIPFEWMVEYYGSDISLWPSAGTQLAAGGPTVLQAFLSGGSPLDSTTWLRTNWWAQRKAFSSLGIRSRV